MELTLFEEFQAFLKSGLVAIPTTDDTFDIEAKNRFDATIPDNGATDAYKGHYVRFKRDTTTVELRGEVRKIMTHVNRTSEHLLGFTNGFSQYPAAGDTFEIVRGDVSTIANIVKLDNTVGYFGVCQFGKAWLPVTMI